VGALSQIIGSQLYLDANVIIYAAEGAAGGLSDVLLRIGVGHLSLG
jgi:hypothetical protein